MPQLNQVQPLQNFQTIFLGYPVMTQIRKKQKKQKQINKHTNKQFLEGQNLVHLKKNFQEHFLGVSQDDSNKK